MTGRLWPLLAICCACGAPSPHDGGTIDSGLPDSGLPDGGPDAGDDGGTDAGTDAGLPPDVRPTTTGPVRGVRAGTSLVFKGIPYAAPPVGPLRFRPPAAAAPWTQVRDASAFGPSCVQVDANGQTAGSEDCLSLNVWTPFTPPAQPLPVLVFVHGGNNQIGCSCDTSNGTPYYDGEYLSEHGPAVVVTLNYRLAAFGFLADPAFALENDAGSTGDYALRDQLFALAWVNDNIAAFGGDPAKLFVFGHSAGSLDVAALVASPLGQGLFTRAGLHSGASVVADPATVIRTWQAAEEATHCDAGTPAAVAACLRAVSPDQLARVPGASFDAPNPQQAQFNPSVDPQVLPQTPRATAMSGNQNKVPMLIGTTEDEYSQLAALIETAPITDDASYQAQVNAIFGATFGPIVLQHYPSSAYPTPYGAFVAILNDLEEICPTRLLARALATTPGQPHLYRFIYTHHFPGPLAQYGAAHGFDVFELFHDVGLVGGAADEASLADAMGRYWVRFADTGDPNQASDLLWAPYEPAADSFQRLDWPLDAGSGARGAQCDFWESQGL